MVYRMPNHHLNQNWLIVKSTPRNKLWWNFNQNRINIIHCKKFAKAEEIAKKGTTKLSVPPSIDFHQHIAWSIYLSWAPYLWREIIRESSKDLHSYYDPAIVSINLSWPLADTDIILVMGSANERRRYIVMLPLIGPARTQNGYGRVHSRQGNVREK